MQCLTSDDPDFESKAADIIGLYLHPAQHAAVFCVDEKSVFRHRALSLYEAFNIRADDGLGKTAAGHTTAEFVAFLIKIVVNQPRGKEIHVVADNLSAHKTLQVKEFLTAHANVHLHFTSTYSSWLNQVGLWFSKIERDLIARDVFTSVSDLKTKLIRHIRRHNKSPIVVKWQYVDSTRRMTTDSGTTVH